MANEKDELISGVELANRLGLSPAYITKNKDKLKKAKCMYGKKYYYNKSALALGKNPSNPHESNQSRSQKKEIIEKPKPKKETKENIDLENLDDDEEIEQIKSLKTQILNAIQDEDSVYDRLKLDGLKLKASILNEYYKSKNEEIKHKKQIENLFDKEEVLKILGFMANNLRNSLINLSSNYAVNLEGKSQKEIKDFVSDDINKILKEIENTGKQFKKV